MRVASAILAAGLGCLLVAGTASAQSEEDCTWFPDLRCGRTDGRWEGFEKPIVSFAQFEDPFITTGLYPYFVWHEFPSQSVMGGGELFAVAVQARVALTDRLAFIATKDGYVWNRPDLEYSDVGLSGSSSVLNDTEGYLNIAAGLKYALIEDRENNFILSPAIRIELATGSSDTFQGYGNGLWVPSVSAAWSPLEKLHLMGGVGGEIPFSSGKLSSSIFYHLYADYQVNERFQPFAQLSGIYWVESGRGELPVRTKLGAFGLRDLTLTQAQDATGSGRNDGTAEFNLGSKGVDNNDLITFAVGSHFPINEHVTFSIAYERPITTRKGIFKQRITTGMRFEF
jgi:hypothetical protein